MHENIYAKMEVADMVLYNVTLTSEERDELHKLVQKGGKGYRIRHAQILLKLDKVPENAGWTYDRIKAAYGAASATISGVAKRFVTEGLEAALGRKKQENYHRKITGDIEARICAIACSQAPEGRSNWTMQLIADELIRLEVVDYITDSTICEVLKKTKLNHGSLKNGVYPK
jgi:transposase